MRRLSTIRLASRLSEIGWPVATSNTTTPTGEVSTRASRSARAWRFGPVGARVGDRGRGLRGEQHQDLLVPVGERRRALLLDEVEVADMHAAMAHRRALEGAPRQPVGGKAEGVHMGGHVRDPERSGQVAEELEQPRSVGPLLDGPVAPPR